MNIDETILRNKGFQQQPDGSWAKTAGTKTVQETMASCAVGGCVLQPLPRQDAPSKRVLPQTPGMSEMERRLNKTEKRFLSKLRGQCFDHIGIQEITLRLGFDLRYTPDFFTIYGPHYKFWEVKGGFEREDAAVKIKVAAAMFPYWSFIKAVWKDGHWTETVVRA